MSRHFKTDFKEQTIGEPKAKGSDKPNRLKNYTCRYCKCKYKMLQLEYAQKSLTRTQTCGKEECIEKMRDKLFEKANKVVRANDRIKKREEKLEKKAATARTRKMKQDAKTEADWKSDLALVLHWIIRTIDKDRRCISHPEMRNFMRYDAGHYFGAHSNSPIRFNAHNIHKQNSQANELYGGCPEYRNGLVDRYSEAYAQMIDGLPLKYKDLPKHTFTIEKIREEYLPALRAMKKEMKANEYFIPTRDEVNATLGIYREDWLEFQYGDSK